MAGQVKARGDARRARSDWMKIEQERGISVTSAVMTFEFEDIVLNLLSRSTQEQDPGEVETPAHLILAEPPVADCARYDRLRKEVTHAAQ